MPGPTVTVRMKEDESDGTKAALQAESVPRNLCPGTFFATELQREERFAMSTDHQTEKRIAAACEAMRAGWPVVRLDDHDRENEADLIAAA